MLFPYFLAELFNFSDTGLIAAKVTSETIYQQAADDTCNKGHQPCDFFGEGEHCNGGTWLVRNAYENMPILSKNPRNPIKLNQLSNGAPIKLNTFSVRDYDSRIFKAYRQGGSVLDLNSQKSRSF